MNAKKKETETPVALKRDMKADKIVVPDAELEPARIGNHLH